MLNYKQLQISYLRKVCLILLIIPGLGYSSTAFAYLDPGTGSIILQSLIAGVMVVAAAWGVFWHRIKSFFSSLFSSAKEGNDEPGHDSDQ